MEQAQDLYKSRGYSDDLLPKIESQRNWKTFNYFTLWMGSVHNVPNYVMVGGFYSWTINVQYNDGNNIECFYYCRGYGV